MFFVKTQKRQSGNEEAKKRPYRIIYVIETNLINNISINNKNNYHFIKWNAQKSWYFLNKISGTSGKGNYNFDW